MQRRTFMLGASAAAALSSQGIRAQGSYPSRPVRFVVPAAAGAATDWIARLVADHMQHDLKQPIVVENRAGANGILGSSYVAKQPADGYTLLVSTNGTHVAAPHLTKSLDYDPLGNFAHVAVLMSLPWALMVRSDFPARNMSEFIAHVRANPGKFSTGHGSASSRLCIHMLRTMAKLDFLDVPYKSLGQTITDVRGGLLHFTFLDIGSALAQDNGGALRALAVTSTERSSSLPRVPVMADVLPGYQMTSWIGLAAPTGTPEPVIRQLEQSVSKALANPEVLRKVAAYGGQMMPQRGEQVVSLIKSENIVWANFVKEAGVEKD